MPEHHFQNRASELILKHLKGELSEAEAIELAIWRAETNDHEALFEEMADEQHLKADVKIIDGLKERLDKRVYAVIPGKKESVPFIHRHLKKWMVAASIIFLFTVCAYFLLTNKAPREGNKNNSENMAAAPQPVQHDVATPKEIKATIRLADGRVIAIDSISSGTLVNQGSLNVEKTADGQIIYSAAPARGSHQILFNTIYNPAGSKIVPVTLGDGTKLWLNSKSSLRFPTAFQGNERRVEITGEAYFEVAKDPAKKFIVSGNGTTTEVLGTHFNINAYSDESSVKVTLLEGSVKVAKDALTGILKPGQQALVGSGIQLVEGVDIEAVMAWKNGMFNMKSADIGTIMRQVARWYDVEIIYENGIPHGTITGEVPRTLNLSEVLKVYEYSGIRYRIEERIVVLK